jgi:phosphonopyruvate decarboxylase
VSNKNNIIAANEGNAIALAAGYYLATGKIPMVYMQNSGIGNAVNPIISLVDSDVYNIPMLLLIGWRGEPGQKDEPQHVKQGKITVSLLETMGIKYKILTKENDKIEEQVKDAMHYLEKTSAPFAFVVQKDTFDDYKLQNILSSRFNLSREEAIGIITATISKRDIIVSTTGHTSRELFEYRESVSEGHAQDFLTVGSMGHASQIALGIALIKLDRKVYCFDGDGALIMHMGAMAIVGNQSPENFIHFVFNNGAHDSVGGQPTVGLDINIPQIALSLGYTFALSADSRSSLMDILQLIKDKVGPIFIEVKVKKGARKNLGRPTSTPIQNKNLFMEFLSGNEQ